MNFLDTILQRFVQQPGKPILFEIHCGALVSTTCGQLLADISKIRSALSRLGLRAGYRCALLGPNSSRWVAFDLLS